MKRVLTTLLICIMSAPVLADSTSHRKVTEEMLLALNIDATMKSMATNIKDMQSRQLKALDLPVGSQPIIDEHLNKTIELLFSAFKWEDIKDQYIDAYVSVYSESEIKDLLTFFRSKSGKKYIEKMPELNALVLKIAESKVQEIQPQMQALGEELKIKLSNTTGN